MTAVHCSTPHWKNTSLCLLLVPEIVLFVQLPYYFIGSGLTLENMMKFLNDGLAHTSGGDVRQASEEVIIKLYRNEGSRVKDYLPQDSDKTRRNVLYKQLFVAFDKIDGKPEAKPNKVSEVETATK